ncbi:MAG: hypothetical protein ACPF9D_03370 [Owenweeksia sp.]
MRVFQFFLWLVIPVLWNTANAQQIPVIEDRETPILKPLKLSGPRVGVTYVQNIESYRLDEKFNDSTLRPNPMVTQFGWQFEWNYFETVGGSAGLFEVIPLIGGLDQGLLIPSLNLLTGYRDASGFEIGAGPNLNLLNTGFTFAFGYNIRSKHMNFPLNVAYTRSREGGRVTLLVGFTKRRMEQ